MADNITLNAGTGGATLATDDVGGVHYPVGKTAFGALDSATLVTLTSGYPVQPQTGSTWAVTGTFWQVTQPVSLASVPLPSGAATAANQATEITSLASIDGKLPALGQALAAASVPVVLTAAQLTTLTPPASVAVTNAGTFAVQAAQSGTWNVTNVSGTVSLPTGAATAANQSTGNTSLASIDGKITAVNTGAVVLAAGTAAVGKLAANSGVTIGAVELAATQTLSTVTTVGTVTTCSTLTGSGVAHDGVDSGNPHLVGAHATTSVSGGTNVSDADRTYLKAGVDGVQITRPHCNLEDIVTGNATNTDGTSTQCIAAGATGVKTYLTTIILANSHATTSCTVDIKDGSTVKLSIPVPANGGAVVNLPVPLPGTAATAWNFDPSAAVTTISCSMVGFKSKV